jgi:hypothetical protein
LNLLKLTSFLFPYYILRRFYLKITGKTIIYPRQHLVYPGIFSKLNKFPKDYDSYMSFVRKGFERMKKQRVVLCGCIRDEEELVDVNISRLEETGRMFKDYRIVVFESDSKDRTLEKLKKRALMNEKIIILNEIKNFTRFSGHGNERMEIMAYCRNKYLEYVQKYFSDFDFMVVADLDMRGGWYNLGIANSIGHDNWDMIGANGLDHGKYYDSYPLRIKDFDDRCYIGGRQNNYDPLIVKKNVVKWIKSKHPDLSPGEDLLPVVSCFSGFGIYKIKAIMGCRYLGDDCEHVLFHKQMHMKGHKKFFINPSMIVILG